MFMNLLLCPRCNATFSLRSHDNFYCKHCKYTAYIEKGILDLCIENSEYADDEQNLNYDTISGDYNTTRGIGISLLPQGLFFIDCIKNVKNNPEIILDLGSGTGFPSIEIATKVQQVIALDISKNMLAQLWIRARMNKIKNILPVRADIYNLPFKNKSIEIVTCHKIFNLLYNPVNAINEIKRVLCDTGRFFVLIPAIEAVEKFYSDCDVVDLYLSAIKNEIGETHFPSREFLHELKEHFKYCSIVGQYESETVFDKTYASDMNLFENHYTKLLLPPGKYSDIIENIINVLKGKHGDNWGSIVHSKAKQNYYVYMCHDQAN